MFASEDIHCLRHLDSRYAIRSTHRLPPSALVRDTLFKESHSLCVPGHHSVGQTDFKPRESLGGSHILSEVASEIGTLGRPDRSVTSNALVFVDALEHSLMVALTDISNTNAVHRCSNREVSYTVAPLRSWRRDTSARLLKHIAPRRETSSEQPHRVARIRRIRDDRFTSLASHPRNWARNLG